MPADRDKERAVRRVLDSPDLFPDEFKAWLPRFIQSNVNLRISEQQLPEVEATRFIGTSGEPAFEHSWVNYVAGFDEAGYYKDPFGMVHLCGIIKSGTLNQSAFNLPGGYRPKARRMFPSIDGVNAVSRVDVTATGDVIPVTGNTAYITLDGIHYRAFS